MTIGGNSQDIHSSGPIGAIIGGGASVSGGTFQGVGGPTPDALTSAQLEQLRVELARLRAQLRQEATEPEHDLAVADVARAEQAAKENKPDEARSALARAGKWVLDIATRIGVPLATEILKKSIEG